MTGVSPTTSTASANEVTSETNRVGGKDTFLKLLVAQIQHQNPLNPADGVEFMTQLTQFSQLEQLMTLNETASKVSDALAPKTAEEPPQDGASNGSQADPTGVPGQ
jgi:flagellar basal-body rod modification protein FlgD